MIVELISSVHTFPLPVELLFVPLATLLAMTQAVAGASPEYAAIRKPLAVVTALLGIAALALHSAIRRGTSIASRLRRI